MIKITLLDINKNMCDIWKEQFKDYLDVKIINNSLQDYTSQLKNKRLNFCIVSPGNSFGMMDGGYDWAISSFYNDFNIDIIKKVQKEIYLKHLGEQPIATTLHLTMGNNVPDLIHIPTMRVPSVIRFTNIPYTCMKELLLYLENNNCDYDEVIVPAFGGSCGQMDLVTLAKQMKLAYGRVLDKDNLILELDNWIKISGEIKEQHYDR